MFERFSNGSRATVVAAHELALALGSGSIGPGHLLYGCAEAREETTSGVAAAPAESRPRPSAACYPMPVRGDRGRPMPGR